VRIDIDEQLDRLEGRITEAEAQVRALRLENRSLRAALEPSGEQAGAPNASPASPAAPDVSPTARPVRQIVLEAERQEIRSRLRNLLEAL